MKKVKKCEDILLPNPNGCKEMVQRVKAGDKVIDRYNNVYFSENFTDERWFDNYSQCMMWDHGHIHWGNNLYVNQEDQYYSRQDRLEDSLPFKTKKYPSFNTGIIEASIVPDDLLAYTVANTHDSLQQQRIHSGIFTTRYDAKNYLNVKQGRISVTAKITNNTSDFGAIWLLAAQKFNRWETEFLDEIDIMEFHGHNSNAIHTTCHYNSDTFTTVGTDHTTQDLSLDFHRFGIDWNNSQIAWMLDDDYIFTIDTPQRLQGDAIMTLIINLAIGGGWSRWQIEHDKQFGIDNGPAVYPSQFEIKNITCSS